MCKWNAPEWQAAWPKLIEEAPLIIEISDVLVTGRWDDNGDLIPPTVDINLGIYFNGVADDGHEPFELGPNLQKPFVKTLMKPYDIAVGCILLRAYLLAPTVFQL